VNMYMFCTVRDPCRLATWSSPSRDLGTGCNSTAHLRSCEVFGWRDCNKSPQLITITIYVIKVLGLLIGPYNTAETYWVSKDLIHILSIVSLHLIVSTMLTRCRRTLAGRANQKKLFVRRANQVVVDGRRFANAHQFVR